MGFLEQRPRLRFVLAFVGLAALGMGVLHLLVYPSEAFQRYLGASASTATTLMGWLGFDARAEGRRMFFESSSSSFERTCDASQTILLYACAVVAFPHGRRRVVAVLLGIVALLAVNVLRVGSLLCLFEYWPSVYDAAHLYLWPVLLLLLSIAMWVAWARRSVEAVPR